MIVFNQINLVECSCGHGARAWHFNNTGQCEYGNCKCLGLRPTKAIITKIFCNTDEDYHVLSGKQFIDYFNENKKELVWN